MKNVERQPGSHADVHSLTPTQQHDVQGCTMELVKELKRLLSQKKDNTFAASQPASQLAVVGVGMKTGAEPPAYPGPASNMIVQIRPATTTDSNFASSTVPTAQTSSLNSDQYDGTFSLMEKQGSATEVSAAMGVGTPDISTSKIGVAQDYEGVPNSNVSPEPRYIRPLRPRRHVSLKNILRIDSYNFVPDIDVSEAQQAVDSSEDEDNYDSSRNARSEGGSLINSYDSNIVHSSSSAYTAIQQGLVLNSPQSDVARTSMPMPSRNLDNKRTGSGCSRFRNAHILESLNDYSIEEALMMPPLEPKKSNVLAVSDDLPRAMKRSIWGLSDYVIGKCLHKGYGSRVYSGTCEASGLKVVLKVYRLDQQSDLQRVQLYREIAVHSRLQHQNVVQFYGAFLEEGCVMIVQQYAAGGDLLHYVYSQGSKLGERDAVKLVLQPLLTALQYLHTKGIVHRDIKPENCLLTEDMTLQLGDFGLSVDLNDERANTRAGTLDYMAPEVLFCPSKATPADGKDLPGAAHYEMSADAWAVGVFAYELLLGKLPFKGAKDLDTARNIIHSKEQLPNNLSPSAVQFITACLAKEPVNRPTILQMLAMPWIRIYQRRPTVNNFRERR